MLYMIKITRFIKVSLKVFELSKNIIAKVFRHIKSFVNQRVY